MADNLVVTAGTGTNVASDEVTYSGDTAKLGIVRLVHVTGAEGAKTVSELVRLEDAAHTSADPGVPVLGVRQDTATSLAGTDGDYTMPIFDASGRQHVNVGASALPTGAATSAKQDTIIGHVDGVETLLGTIDADTSALAGAVSGTEVQVDVLTLPALPAGTNNIGDVDVLSVIPGTGATNLGKAIDTATGATDTGVLALATRDDALSALTPIEGDNVQLRTDANGALWVKVSGTVTVDGSGVTQPVSHAALTELAAAINASSQMDVNIAASGATVPISNAGITTIAGAVAGTEMQVDVLTMPTITETSASAIKTAVELLDDTVATDGAATPTKGILMAGQDGTNAQTLKTDTSGELQIDVLTIAAGDNNIGNVDIASIAAGDNNIGNVDVATVPADPFGANADAASATGSISAKLKFIASTGIPVTGTVTVGSHAVTNAGTFAVQAASAGDVAHDAADSGNPVKIGGKATVTEQTAVSAADERVNASFTSTGKQIVAPCRPS